MWPFKRRQDPGTDQSKMAVKDATAALNTIASRHIEVLSLANELRQIRNNNHFADGVTRIMMERKK